MSKGDDFQTALCCEDDNEDQVDPVKNGFLLKGLLVCFHHHGHHVEADQHHDENVKELFCHQVED